MTRTHDAPRETFVETARIANFGDVRFRGDLRTPAFDRMPVEMNGRALAAARSGVAPGGIHRPDFLAQSDAFAVGGGRAPTRREPE